VPGSVYFHAACFAPVIIGFPSHHDQALDCRNTYVSAALPIILCPLLLQGEEEEEEKEGIM
jgi:hypothetical protein